MNSIAFTVILFSICYHVKVLSSHYAQQSVWDNSTILNRPVKVVVSSNTKYFSVFLNWLLYYNQVSQNASMLFIICLDEEVGDKLKKVVGLECSHTHQLPTAAPFNRLWTVRTQLTVSLLEQGYDVILSDTDALWLRSPFLELQRYPHSDIIGTRAKFPENVYEFYGATLCMGFVYIKSKIHMIVLWKELAARLTRSSQPDDQKFINDLMLRSRLHFPERILYYKSNHSDTGYFTYQRQRYNITLLAQSDFRRLCDPRAPLLVQQSTIAHCVTFQKAEKFKKIAESAYGLWILNNSWNEASIGQHSFADFIHTLNGSKHL